MWLCSAATCGRKVASVCKGVLVCWLSDIYSAGQQRDETLSSFNEKWCLSCKLPSIFQHLKTIKIWQWDSNINLQIDNSMCRRQEKIRPSKRGYQFDKLAALRVLYHTPLAGISVVIRDKNMLIQQVTPLLGHTKGTGALRGRDKACLVRCACALDLYQETIKARLDGWGESSVH